MEQVHHWFSDAIVARYVRLHVLGWYRFPALRVEIYEAIAWTGNEWIELDFGREVVLTGLATQGANGRAEWVSAYSISYRSDELTSWLYYQIEAGVNAVLPGNHNASTQYNSFHVPIEARYARLHVREFSERAALRLEFFRERLNYYIVDAAIISPKDTSHIVHGSNFTAAIAGHTTAAGDSCNHPEIAYNVMHYMVL